MKQVVQSARGGQLTLRDVPAPKVRAGHLLVATTASLISAGTERMIVEFAAKSLAGKAMARPDLVRKVLDKARRDGLVSTFHSVMARLDEAIPLGYSAAGRVIAVGAGLEGRFRVGQRVAVAGAGLANHAEFNTVPQALAVPVPDDVPDEQASFATVGAIALHAVRNLGAGLGDVVAVLGVGLVGQIAVQLLALQGARVVALDYNPARLDLARRLGAEFAANLGQAGVEPAVAALTGGLGADAILVAAATESAGPLETAAAIARDRARVCLVGKTGTAFPFADYMKKELQIVVSRSYGPGRYDEDFEGRGIKYPPGFARWTETENLRECVRLMSPALPRRLDLAALISHRFRFEDAEDAYTLVTGNTEPHLGVVLGYPEQELPGSTRVTLPKPKLKPAARCVLGVIGAGNFARAVLLPELARLPNVNLKTIVTQRGLTSEHAGAGFGFATAASEPAAVFEDTEVNAVLIATRHASHAGLVAQALAAGKAVFVEKPLATDHDGLAEVVAARLGSGAFFTVGFNRRFAPMARKAKAHLERHAGPKFLLLRVNAGALPAESWVNAAEEGGGRLVGEACHFIDLARFWVGQPITAVQADAAAVSHGVCDDAAITLTFADGSLASIAYTALGDSAFSKERYELFAGGTVVTIDNFLTMTVTANGTTTTEKAAAGQDKGHRDELKAFAAAVAGGGAAPVDEAELLEVSAATLAVLDSLREGRRVSLARNADSCADTTAPAAQ